ncbi:MAG: C-terminal binding protein [Chloroflexi bacterium]|nr:C-terminal binding protein [Chloroflexota bacterium]
MAQFLVIATDPPSPEMEVEKALLAPAGIELVGWPVRDDAELARVAADADGIMCDATPVTERVYAAAPRLRIVAEYGIGYDNIDVAAATAYGVWAANVPGFCTPEVADHTLALILAASRQLLPLDRAIRATGWASGPDYPLRALHGLTLGLVGFGNVGRAVAARARGFGLRILAHSRSLTAETAASAGVELAALDPLFAESDFVSLHLPATPETRGLVGADRLRQMRRSAWLINTSRGSLVDEEALADALASGRLAGAALDVRASEPPTSPDRLGTLPNVILTPHTAYYSPRAMRALGEGVARNVLAALTHGRPEHPINVEAEGAYRQRFGARPARSR